MAQRESRDFKASAKPVKGDTPAVQILCVPPIEIKMPPITINDPSSRRILSVGLSKLEATFTKVYWKQNLTSEQDRQRIVKINGYSIEIYKGKKGKKPVKVLNTRDVINVYDPSINPRCTKRSSALDIIAFEKDEKETRYLITLQMEKNPSVAAYACREMFTGLQTAIQHGFLDVVLTTHGDNGKSSTGELQNLYVILRPPNLHFYSSFSSLSESRPPLSLEELTSVFAPSAVPEAIAKFDDAVARGAFDLYFEQGPTRTTLTVAASNRKETRDEDVMHSRTLADILRSWRSGVPRSLYTADFRFARFFLTKEREVGFGVVLGLRSQAPPSDRAPFFWETKPQIRVVMLSKCVRACVRSFVRSFVRACMRARVACVGGQGMAPDERNIFECGCGGGAADDDDDDDDVVVDDKVYFSVFVQGAPRQRLLCVLPRCFNNTLAIGRPLFSQHHRQTPAAACV